MPKIEQEVINKITEQITHHAELNNFNHSEITDSSSLDSIGIDSIGIISIIFSIENIEGVNLDNIAGITPPKTVGEIFKIALKSCG